jgi:hypothetical protein
MFLKPHGKIDLKHRAFFLQGVPSKTTVIVAAQDGQFSILSTDLKDVRARRIRSTIRAIVPHPTEPIFAFVNGDSGSLIVQSQAGRRLHKIAPPEIDEDSPKWIKQRFDDCF